MESKQHAPLSAVKELATSLMPRCLVVLLSVGRENRWKKPFREMLSVTYINKLLCCW